MTTSRTFTINIDGAARGNPGPAAFAFVIAHDGQPVLEEKGYLGETTNNVAEYTALVKALERAADLKGEVLHIRSDSELLVKQMNGQYKVKNENLRPLFEEANRLSRRFREVDIQHVYREDNKEADRLCNEALDEAKQSGVGSKGKPPPKLSPQGTGLGRPAPADWKGTLENAEQILNDAARTWIKTGRKSPTPGEILQQIIKLLQERGFVAPTA